MKTDLRSMLRGALLSRKDELESALHQARLSWHDWRLAQGSEDTADEADGALQETSTHNHCALMERKTRELRKINDLLRRMESDEEFGLCEECGDPIPFERLMVLPDATYCVPCQCLQERRNGLRLTGAWGGHCSSERRARDWENPDDEETAMFDSHIEPMVPVDPDLRGASSIEGDNPDG
jgi:DnaK suppressor protein